jgi:Bacterial archaeo-eukaryotic release factor family 3
MFTIDDLRPLITAEAQPAVSIFMPTHPAGREIRQDPVRLRKLIDDAVGRLERLGHRRPDAEGLLQPARALVADENFWRHQDRGLAVFIAPGMFRHVEVPIELPEEVVVGKHFHVKHLLPLVSGHGHFLVLAITARRARLFDGTRFGLIERTDIDFPEGVAEITAETTYENTRHMSPVARTRAGTPGGVAKTQNLGEDPESQRKAQLIEYLHRVEAALRALPDERVPMVLAAQPEVLGNFRAISKCPDFVEPALEINPDALTVEDLHGRAYALLEPRFARERDEGLDQVHQLLGERDGRATTQVEEIVKAAHYGRVDTLFVAMEEHVWGRFDEAADKVVAHLDAEAEDEDLLDYAAIETLRQGGQVAVMPKRALPRDGVMAAILRY